MERFESHFEFFSFKFNFLELFKNFVPDFENLYYLLHLSIKESGSENSESKRDCSKDSCRNAWVEFRNRTSKARNFEDIEGERNPNGNRAAP